ncbi:hypothetical protein J6590_069336 [Homalodisca vitripennis]|nr:hypothetical protein J6590_069336 [Homalodisca vitripennis]
MTEIASRLKQLLFMSCLGLVSKSIESVNGISWKIVFSGLILIFQLVITVLATSISMYHEPAMEYVSKTAFIYKLVCILMTVYSVIMAVYDYRTKVASVLNLEKVEYQLSSENLVVTGKGLQNSVLLASLLVYACHIHKILEIFLCQSDLSWLSISLFLMKLHFHGIKWSQFVGCVWFSLRSLTLHYAVNREIDSVCDVFHNTLQQKLRRLRKRSAWTGEKLATVRRKIGVLKRVQNGLQQTEEDINTWYRIYVVFFALASAVFSPLFGLTALSDSFQLSSLFHELSNLSISHNVIFIITIIAINEKIKTEKLVMLVKLTKLVKRCENVGHHKNRKREITLTDSGANQFLDTGYPLWVAILDMSMVLYTLNITRTMNIIQERENIFQRLASCVHETENLQLDHNKRKQLTRPVRRDMAPDVLAAIQLNPCDSSKRVTTDAEISQQSVLRILNDNKIHLYRISLHQELHEPSKNEFCLWTCDKMHENEYFFTRFYDAMKQLSRAVKR